MLSVTLTANREAELQGDILEDNWPNSMNQYPEGKLEAGAEVLYKIKRDLNTKRPNEKHSP